MIVTKKNRRQLLDFLLFRWKTRTTFAAIEKFYIASDEFAKSNNIKSPIKRLNIGILPCRQIAVIKSIIMQILPEASFINYEYESPAPLKPEDFMEMFIADHELCISKVELLMNKLKIV